jgi:hypothetical protein
MSTAADPARAFRRSSWPDVLIVVAIALIGGGGALALWGEDLFGPSGPKDLPVEQAPASSTGT